MKKPKLLYLSLFCEAFGVFFGVFIKDIVVTILGTILLLIFSVFGINYYYNKSKELTK